MINELAQEIHKNAVSKGFYENPPSIPERLALIHSEVSEALEADRKGLNADLKAFNECRKADDIFESDKEYYITQSFERLIKNSFEDELADIMIRVMDLAAHKNIDLEAHIKAKMRYNSLREYKHGKKY